MTIFRDIFKMIIIERFHCTSLHELGGGHPVLELFGFGFVVVDGSLSCTCKCIPTLFRGGSWQLYYVNKDIQLFMTSFACLFKLEILLLGHM